MKICKIENCGQKHRANGLCKKHYNDYWRMTFPEKMKAAKKSHHSRNKDKISSYNRKHRQDNLLEFTERRKQAYLKFKDKELKKAKEWRTNNPERMEFLRNRYRVKRKKQLLLATPQWVNQIEIEQFYINCPEDKVVDHIIPLLGKNVCGLHVPWNFQYLTHEENTKKGNRL